MYGTKPWWKSKTVWGIIIAVIVGLGEAVGVPAAAELPDWLATIVQIVALAYAAYGRWMAKDQLS